MPRVGGALGIFFYVYAEDHNPPHVHAIVGDDEGLLEISTGAVLVGWLPGAKLRQALEWLAQNREAVTAAWDRFNP
jgi:Domain of unknown function (DUF4160)